MKKSKYSVPRAVFGVISASVMAFGCGAVDEGGLDDNAFDGDALAAEDVEFDEIGAAFSADSCKNADYDKKYYNALSHTSPRSYNTCYKGYVVELHNIDRKYVRKGTGTNGEVNISWGDTKPTKAQCANTELAVYVYKRVNGAWKLQGGEHTRTGYWVDPPTDGLKAGPLECSGLEVSLPGLEEEADYRFAATARLKGETRKVKFKTVEAEDIK